MLQDRARPGRSLHSGEETTYASMEGRPPLQRSVTAGTGSPRIRPGHSLSRDVPKWVRHWSWGGLKVGEQGGQRPHKCPLGQERNSPEHRKGCGEPYNWSDQGHLSSKEGPTLHVIPSRPEADINPSTGHCNDLDSEGFCENGEGSPKTLGRDSPLGWCWGRGMLRVQTPHRVGFFFFF